MLAIINIPWIHKEKAATSHEGALYAAMDCIKSGNPALAQSLHDTNDLPPFSASLTEGVLRLGVMRRDVFMALNKSKLAHMADVERPTTAEDLVTAALDMPLSLRIELISPTLFGRNGFNHILPDMELFWGSLARRWVDQSENLHTKMLDIHT